MSRQINSGSKIELSENQRNVQKGGKLLFTTYKEQPAALLIVDNRLRAAQFFPAERSLIGAVYIAKVKNVVKNLDACFVEIGGEQRQICFLSGKDGAHPFLLNRRWDGRILEGDEFPVQVTRDAQKTKQPSVTTLISLSNEYFALSVGNSHTGFSAKLSTEQKKSLRNLLKKAGCLTPEPIPLPCGGGMEAGTETAAALVPVGLVVRTQAAELLTVEDGEALLLEALQQLTLRWRELFQTALHRTCFSCLLEPPAPWQDALEHLVYPGEYEEILTDDEHIYAQLQARESIPADKTIRLYTKSEREELPLAKLYGLEHKLDTALNRRVWLKSGGYLIIEATEALTVIDVNSGKCEASGASQEVCARINREAAEEIALQLRLRNLSGIIIVDFINMKSVADQKSLMNYLSALTASDRQKTDVIDITSLGLVEITRKKNRKPLAEQINLAKRNQI